MKILTVHQPWAQLLVLGEKRFEVRPWRTTHRGSVAIHSGRRFPEHLRELCETQPLRELLARHGFARASQLPRGLILGCVEILECVPLEEYEPASASRGDMALATCKPGSWVWKIGRATLYPRPIPWVGRLGLCDLPDEVLAHAESHQGASQGTCP